MTPVAADLSVAISNQRLVSIDDGKVAFRWKDYTHGNRQRCMSLDAVEFLRRFLLHVLPKGFMHIRYYGFLANRNRAESLQRAPRLLQKPTEKNTKPIETEEGAGSLKTQTDELDLCPHCKRGRLIVIGSAEADPARARWSFDSS